MLTPNKKLEEIRKHYQETSDSGFTCVIYGEAGAGKTHLLSTAKTPLLLMSFDPRGSSTLEHVCPDLISNGDIIIDRRWEVDDNGTLYASFHKELTTMYKEGVFNEIETLAIDSFSRVNDSLINWLKSKRQAEQGFGSAGDGAQYGQMQIQDWGKFAESCTKTLTKLMALPCDVVITAHSEHDKDDTTGEVITSLSVEGKKMKARMPNLISEVYRLENPSTPNGKRKLWTTRSGRYRAKSRLGLESCIENPSISAIQDLAREQATRARTIKQEKKV